MCGNATRLRHSWMGTEKSHLFFLTNLLAPRNSFAERIGQAFGKARTFLIAFGHLITLLENRRVYLFGDSFDVPAYSKPPQVSKVKSL